MIRWFILLELLFSLPAIGQKEWSLEECIRYAKENNIKLKQQTLDIEDTQLDKKQAISNYGPSVGIGAVHNVTFGRVLDPTTYEFIENKTGIDMNFSISSSVNLFAGMKNRHTVRRAKVGIRIATLNVEKLKNDLSLNITKAYLDILLLEENIRISEQKINTLKEQKIRTLKLIEAEKNTKGDLLQVESQLYEIENNLIQVLSQRDIAKLNLCQLMEINFYQDFEIVKPESFVTIPLSFNQNFSDILSRAQSLPEIQSALLEIESSKFDVSIAKAMLFPTLSLNGGYGSQYSDSRKKMKLDKDKNPIMNGSEIQYEKYSFGTQVKDNRSGYVTLNLSIPILNSKKYKNQVTLHEIAKRRTEYNLELKKKQLAIEINEAIINVTKALAQYRILEKNVEITRETFLYTEKKLNTGVVSYFDYITALNNLTMASLQLSLAKYEYLFCKKIIDFYLGVPITL